MVLDAEYVKQWAANVGLDACGLAAASAVDSTNNQALQHYLAQGYHGHLGYMERNLSKRLDVTLLEPGAQTVLVALVNYKQPLRQPAHVPQIAQYAYGADYHRVIKDMLYSVLAGLRQQYPALQGRALVDTAPLLERYWAVQAGLGWIGNNSMLIHPQLGSFTLIGVLLLHAPCSQYDTPHTELSCGSCVRCMQHCPTQAIVQAKVIDARRCLSYLTIERAYTAHEPSEVMHQARGKHRYVFGCDICQNVCPWNKHSPTHSHPWLAIEPHRLAIEATEWLAMDAREFNTRFAHSPIARAGWQGMHHNVQQIQDD